MKHITPYLFSLVFILFVACDSGSDAPPPQPALPQPASVNQSLNDLNALAQKAKGDCSGEYTPILTLLIAQSRQPGGSLPPVLPQSQGPCKNDISQLLLAFSTLRISNGVGQPDSLYASLPQAQAWIVSVAGKVARDVAGNLTQQGITLTDQQKFALVNTVVTSAQQQLTSVASNPQIGSSGIAGVLSGSLGSR